MPQVEDRLIAQRGERFGIGQRARLEQFRHQARQLVLQFRCQAATFSRDLVLQCQQVPEPLRVGQDRLLRAARLFGCGRLGSRLVQ